MQTKRNFNRSFKLPVIVRLLILSGLSLLVIHDSVAIAAVKGLSTQSETTAAAVIAHPVTAHPAEVKTAVLSPAIKNPAAQIAALNALVNQYRKLQSISWTPLATGEVLTVGMRHPKIPVIRQRLMLLGDLMGSSNTPDSLKSRLFDKNLLAAVLHFQKRYGLVSDGMIGPKTMMMLNISPAKLAQQLTQNIKKWQKLPGNLGTEYIWVNIPTFELDLIKDDQIVLNMRTIVGKKDRQTPELISKVNTLIINPEWNIPDSIIKKDIAPKVQKDPNYLAKKNIRIYAGWNDHARRISPASINWYKLQNMPTIPYRLTQMSGKNNALGQVKFVFLNTQDIYLHDTPEKRLFDNDLRADSSGCVRLEQPLKLLEYLVNHHVAIFNLAKVQKYLAAGETKYIRMFNPVPIYITYLTAWVDGSGSLQLREDVYQKNDPST